MTQHRALEWLHLYGRRYPWAWEEYAHLHASPPMEWPTWCWMPLAGAYAVLSRGGRCTPEQAADIGTLGALAAWRATQGIYRVHPTLLAELLVTPVSGDLPADVLTRLPEWCVYVETPGHRMWTTNTRGDSVPGIGLHGFWAYLEHDTEAGRKELRLVLDLQNTLEIVGRPGQVVVHLTGTLEQGITDAVKQARVQALRAGQPEAAPPLSEVKYALEVAGLVSVLLYLCADEAEIDDQREPPPKVVRGAKRPLMPAAKAPVVHATGARLGTALDAARAAAEHGDGSGSGVTPHVRRAHWHAYWTGPRDGARRITARWLSPILVGFEGVPEEATVRPVGG